MSPAIEDKPSDRPLCVKRTACLAASRLDDIPPITLYTSPGLLDVVCGLIRLARSSFWMSCYCFDSQAGVAAISALLRNGVEVRILFDDKQIKDSSCSRQYTAMLELWSAAASQSSSLVMKSYRPPGTGFPTMHVKSWFLDDKVYMGGSYNFTNNAETSNAEHVVVARNQEVCVACTGSGS